MSTFDISITADTLCPWCYINQKRLTRAINLYKKTYSSRDNFTITYTPYTLGPDFPKTSVPLQQKMVEKNGAERTPVLQKFLSRTGQAEGIKFSYGSRIGNSRDSHRLIALAGRKGPAVQEAVMTEVFYRYYEGDADITDIGMLVDAGVAGGMDREELEAWMRSGEAGEWVDRESAKAREKGIRGVPHMVINGSVEVDGAKDVDDLFELFVQMKEAEKKE